MAEYYHWNLDPVCFSIFGMDVRYYSILWGVGLIAAFYAAKYIFIREKFNQDIPDRLFFYVVIGTFLGARLGHCLFYEWEYFSHHPLEIILPFHFSGSGIRYTGYAGLASHGGAIGILVSLFLFHRKYKVSKLSLLDVLGIIAPLAGAFIRVGNFMNSEIVGAPAEVPCAIVFDSVDNLPRHPAQLYEAVLYFVIFGILMLFYRKGIARINSGAFFGFSILLIFISRFVIEYCKEIQEPFEIGLRHQTGMDMGQFLSIPFILAGVIFICIPFVRKLRRFER